MINKNTISLGDCISLMKDLEDNSIDLIISDPPYNLFSKLKWDKPINWDLFWQEANRITKKDAAILLFATGHFKYELYNSNPKMFKYDMVWKKSKAGNPFNAKYMPLRKHEYIMVFGKGKTKYNPQLVEGTPYKRNFTKHKKNNIGYGIKGVAVDNKGTRHPDMVLEFPQKWSKQQQLYSTQKPVKLLQWLIRSYSNEKDLILDPTMGSASSLIAALKEKRYYIGFDLNPEAYEIAEKRIINFKLTGSDYY